MAEPVRPSPVDAAVGAVAGALDLAWWASRPARAVVRAALRFAAVLPGPSPAEVAGMLAARGRRAMAELDPLAETVAAAVVRRVVGIALTTLDLTTIVRDHVDLDAVAEDLDVEAVIARVDLDAVVARVDLDAAVARVDLDAVVARVDLDAAVARVDLDGAVARVDLDGVVAQVDLDGAVARVDIGAIVRRLDLDAIAATLDVDAVVARADLDAVLARFDLVAIAREVIDAIDLPEIVRASSGTLASETVLGVRAETMHADDAVERFVDRLLRRRRLEGPAYP